MKNYTTEQFCDMFNIGGNLRKFAAKYKRMCACYDALLLGGNLRKFAAKYKRMRECYDALLIGWAEDDSPRWAWEIAQRALTPAQKRQFVVWCGRRTLFLMNSGVRRMACRIALDAAKNYAEDTGGLSELENARTLLQVAIRGARVGTADFHAIRCAACAVDDPVDPSAVEEALLAARESGGYNALRAEGQAQLEHLKFIGNPFEE